MNAKLALLTGLLLATKTSAAPVCPVLPAAVLNLEYDQDCNIRLKPTITIQQVVISTASQTMTISTAGFQHAVGQTFTFSSGVVIMGDLEVKSSRQRAIYLPQGGIHLEDATPGSSPPGLLSAKQVRASTITMVGSALLFQDSLGVIKATMTSTELEIDGVSAGKVQNKNTGSGAPATTACDEAGEFGLQYVSRTPSRLYICADNGAGGYEWRFVNISP